MTTPETDLPPKLLASKAAAGSIAELSNRILLQSYAPAAVTTDSYGNILYVHGDINRYLRQPEGAVTTNVMEMARDGLQLDLRAALHAALQGEPASGREVILKSDNTTHNVTFSVRLLPTPGNKPEDRALLVCFQDVVKPKRAIRKRGKDSAKSDEQMQIEQLERELSYARENVQAIIEEQQATNEELKSANEELQSTNEELQSSNEELETSREELQSLNEETITVNSELNDKVEQLMFVQSDLKNLLDNVNTGTLFLDYKLVIRRYTREAQKVYRLIASDIGRPLGDITSNLEGADLLPELNSVLETLIPREREVRAIDGAWYLARMQPYRTLDNVIDGVVLTFTDITENRAAAQLKLAASKLAQQLAEAVVNTVREPLLVLDAQLQVVSASRAFYEFFQVKPEHTLGQMIYNLGREQWNTPELRRLLEEVLPLQNSLEDYLVEHEIPERGKCRLVLNARQIMTTLNNAKFILLSIVPTQ